MMPCQEVRRLAERFVALELPRDDEHAVRRHLRECRECRDYLLEREPALLFAVGPVDDPVQVDDAFVAGVLGGVSERRLERALRSRRRRWMAAAAALLLAVLGGLGGLRLMGSKAGVVAAVAVPEPAGQNDEPPTVTFEGDDVRLYQVSLAGDPGVQVAFMVDPNLEL